MSLLPTQSLALKTSSISLGYQFYQTSRYILQLTQEGKLEKIALLEHSALAWGKYFYPKKKALTVEELLPILIFLCHQTPINQHILDQLNSLYFLLRNQSNDEGLDIENGHTSKFLIDLLVASAQYYLYRDKLTTLSVKTPKIIFKKILNFIKDAQASTEKQAELKKIMENFKEPSSEKKLNKALKHGVAEFIKNYKIKKEIEIHLNSYIESRSQAIATLSTKQQNHLQQLQAISLTLKEKDYIEYKTVRELKCTINDSEFNNPKEKNLLSRLKSLIIQLFKPKPEKTLKKNLSRLLNKKFKL